MATMYPAQIPMHVKADPFRAAEIDVFGALRDQLPSEFTVFYSRPWLGLKPTGEEVDGEADFIVVHPEWGLFSIEVKGGAIKYDAASDTWTTRDRHGFVHRIKDPVQQAKTSKYRVVEQLNTRMSFRFMRLRHGVVFPDSGKPSEELGADKPRSIFCFAEDFPAIGAWVQKRMGAGEKLQGREQPLGADGVAAAVHLLAKSFELRVPAIVDIRREEREIEYLSTEQYWILDFLQNQPRCAIAGPAGSGKTVLALEKALRCASAGQQTLLLCFNRPLAKFLKSRVAGQGFITVQTFHELVASRASQAGMKIKSECTAEELAELLQKAGSTGRVAYACVIVDEGQDFHPAWWSALEQSVITDQTSVYVFYDNQQQLYTMPATFTKLLPQAPFPLTNNLRNSKPVFRAAAPWFGRTVVRPLGPDGVPVKWIDIAGSRQPCLEVISSLINEDRLDLSQIAVLTVSEDEAALLRARELSSLSPVTADSIPQRELICSGIRRYKGLDAAVVLLHLPREALPEPELLYVGLTRARSMLIVLANTPVLTALRDRITKSATV